MQVRRAALNRRLEFETPTASISTGLVLRISPNHPKIMIRKKCLKGLRNLQAVVGHKRPDGTVSRPSFEDLIQRVSATHCDHCKPDGRVFHEKGKPCPHLDSQNAERIHGGVRDSKSEPASTPLDGASC